MTPVRPWLRVASSFLAVAGRAALPAGLVVCAGLAASASALAEDATRSEPFVLDEASLEKFRRYYDPDVPPSFLIDDAAPGASQNLAALAPEENLGGGWWFGSAAPPVGLGLQSSVNAMIEYNGELVVAGDFWRAGGDLAYRIAKWDGTAWTPLGNGMNHRVFSLFEYQGTLLAGGAFTLADNAPAYNIAQWDGSSWSPIGPGPGGPGPGGPVYCMAEYRGNLYAGGDFLGYLKVWNGTTWNTFGGGVNNIVTAIAPATVAVLGDAMLVGGLVTVAGSRALSPFFYLWNDSAWLEPSRGLNNWVSDIYVRSDTLWVGGNFTTASNIAGPVTVNRIARYAGSTLSFSAVGSGVSDAVLSVTDHAGNIIVGGQFESAGTLSAKRIASWNGSQWSTFGNGFSGGGGIEPHVRAVAAYNGDLYAGGWFTSAGGLDSRHIARWIDTPAPRPVTGVETVPVLTARGVRVAVSPNPFAVSTRVTFSLPSPSRVQLAVHDVRGRHVRTLLDEEVVEGTRSTEWNGRDAAGRVLASGVYFLRLEVNGIPQTRRVVLAR